MVGARKNMKSAVTALAVVVGITALTSCGDETPGWRDAGIHQVEVTELIVPDTVRSDEVLSTTCLGRLRPGER